MFYLIKGIYAIVTFISLSGVVQVSEYRPPQVDDGWQTAFPSSVGLDPGFVINLRKKSANGTYRELTGVIVIMQGKLVIEEYFNGGGIDNKHDIRSAGKSFTSTLFGLALDKGLLESEEEYIFPLLKEYLLASPSNRLKELKLKHLLSMSSGFDANEDDPSTPGYEEKMYETNDWVQFAINTPLSKQPGVSWAYASLNPTIIGFALEVVTNESLEDFAKTNFFAPLQITDYIWQKSPKGRIIAAGNLLIKTRDMAKLGQLFLNNGKWNGKQIISKEWVTKATNKYFDTGYGENSFQEGYGYLWWIHNFNVSDAIYPVFFASGNGGQKIYVVPDKELVVAIQTTAYGKGWAHRQSVNILTDAIASTK